MNGRMVVFAAGVVQARLSGGAGICRRGGSPRRKEDDIIHTGRGEPPRLHAGSALLIVLGMLAFMVISGVAFSVFMRATRMPSSFTRRVVATRQLAKAALAEAIDKIDRSVANDPHPNVRRDSSQSYNVWVGRVLSQVFVPGYAPSDSPSTVISTMTNDNENDDTVPVLSLEALAYIPPPLVNEVRYYGQKTPTAEWQTFDFDSGRYAFIALDVSDYFDINRLVADEARSSNPGRRVTYSYAFDDADHCKWQGGASTWDTFMDTYRQVEDDGTFSFGSKIPLVSLADFNLSYGSQTIGGFKSPFYQYIKTGGGGNGFYDATPDDGEDSIWWKYAEMTYVTDSLDAPYTDAEKKTDDGLEIWDLDDETYQPFTDTYLKQAQRNRTLNGVWHQSSKTLSRLLDHGVPEVTLFALSDYLDQDRVPISLGIPTVERVPMICAIQPQIQAGALKITVTDLSGASDTVVTGVEGTDETIEKERTVHWRVDAASLRDILGGGSGVKVLVTYPFRNHENKSESGFFKLDGKMQVFLSTEQMRLRTGNQSDLLHWGASDVDNATSLRSADFVSQAVFNFPLAEQGVNFTTTEKPEDCVKQVELSLDRTSCASLINSSLANDDGDLLRVTYRWTLTGTDQGNGVIGNYTPSFVNEIPSGGTVVTDSGKDPAASFLALKKDGTTDTSFLQTIATTPNQNLSFYLNIVPTVRVKSSESTVVGSGGGTKTVDLVPATIYDDEPLNEVGNSIGRLQDLSGRPTPLMKFDAGAPFVINPQTTASAVSMSVAGSPAAVMVDDPRYNHAPENWKTLANFSESGWLAAQSSGNADRDGDIYMATSDQNYLQSIYELGFLPRLSNLVTFDEEIRGSLPGYPDPDNSWTALCQNAPIDAGLMWKTYDIFGRFDNGPDDFEGLGFENLGRGLRVNPYSDATNVIMAAFANTPLCWRLAADSDSTLNPAFDLDAQSFNQKYAWNEYSSGGKISWDLLSAAAGEFAAGVRTRAVSNNGDWRDALLDIFDREAQYDTSDYFCGLKLDDFPPENGENSPLYSIDKKFLYGFWRNCFSARQQLFLVFFRAEPMMLGGGVAGVTPPQLGAKGVALVWRNPNKTSGSDYGWDEDYRPHQTRILFYKQFE